MIRLTYEAVDGFRKSKKFQLLRGARKYAQEMVGRNPSISGASYAVSDDGVGKIHLVEGCRLKELFGDEPKEPE